MQISPKSIQVLSELGVEYYLLHDALYGAKRIDSEAVKRSLEKKITGFGFCCPDRAFHTEPIVAYGASEMMHV